MNELPAHVDRRIADWSLGRVAEAVGGRLEDEAETDRGLCGISTDTRTLERGELFVAIRGENFDGHGFVEEAAEAGATGAIVEAGFEAPKDLASDFCLLYVEKTRSALAALGHSVWEEARKEGAHTVDVTGSNGKTTTKELLGAVWSTRGEVFATPGNLNNEIGLPLSLCALPATAEHLVFEMGANAPGEISELIEMAPGDERIITSIGYAHTEGFGSIEGIRRAKSEIFEAATAETTAIVPEAEVAKLELEKFPGRVRTFGRQEGADLRLVDFREADGRPGIWEARYAAAEFGPTYAEFDVRLGLPGAHNGLNLAAALLTLLVRGMEFDPAEISEALASIDLPAGRWRRWRRGDLAFIDDAYNANPSSVRASYAAFRDTQPPESLGESAGLTSGEVPRIAVLGEMCELGDRAEYWHREVAAELVGRGELTAFCGVGEYAEAMTEAATQRDETIELTACQTVDEAAEWLLGQAPAFVWMKASRANGLERVIELVDQMRDDG